MQQKKNNLRGRAAVVNSLLATDKTWQAPVQKDITSSSDKVFSLAQWVNTFGRDGLKEDMLVMGERGSRNFEQCYIKKWDMSRDKTDPHNYGYWHRSLATVVWLSDGKTQQLPFSMVLVEAEMDGIRIGSIVKYQRYLGQIHEMIVVCFCRAIKRIGMPMRVVGTDRILTGCWFSNPIDLLKKLNDGTQMDSK